VEITAKNAARKPVVVVSCAFPRPAVLTGEPGRENRTMRAEENWKELEQRIAALIKLAKRPVAVAFLDAAPAGVKKFDGTEPSGSSFWRLAAEGRVFYTVPENHFNCATGARRQPGPLPREST
jgi:Uncharacterised ArCR, COG2043